MTNRPSFFIVGHSKSGTTALATFLDQHPELFVCEPMEPNFFCPSWCRAEDPSSSFVRRTEDEYLRLFDEAASGQRCGEASAVYLYAPEAAARIHAFNPEAQIIMIFREPADFVRSLHLQMLKNVSTEGEVVKNLGEAIALESERRKGRSVPSGCVIPELLLYTTERLAYADQYDRFADLFPTDRILALTYDDFRHDNAGTVRRVHQFLGVDAGFQPELAEHNVGGSELRSKRTQRLLHRATHGTGAIASARALLPRRLRRRAIGAAYGNLAFRPAQDPDREVVDLIRSRARPHVAALGDRLGRNLLEEWGYGATATLAQAGSGACR